MHDEVGMVILKHKLALGEKRAMLGPGKENPCCTAMKQLTHIEMRHFLVGNFNINYCPTCGRRLAR